MAASGPSPARWRCSAFSRLLPRERTSARGASSTNVTATVAAIKSIAHANPAPLFAHGNPPTFMPKMPVISVIGSSAVVTIDSRYRFLFVVSLRWFAISSCSRRERSSRTRAPQRQPTGVRPPAPRGCAARARRSLRSRRLQAQALHCWRSDGDAGVREAPAAAQHRALLAVPTGEDVVLGIVDLDRARARSRRTVRQPLRNDSTTSKGEAVCGVWASSRRIMSTHFSGCVRPVITRVPRRLRSAPNAAAPRRARGDEVVVHVAHDQRQSVGERAQAAARVGVEERERIGRQVRALQPATRARR